MKDPYPQPWADRSEAPIVGKYGKSIGSKSYEYDILGRKIKETSYNNDGLINVVEVIAKKAKKFLI